MTSNAGLSAFTVQHSTQEIPVWGRFSKEAAAALRGTMPVPSLKLQPNYCNISRVCHSPRTGSLHTQINDTKVVWAIPTGTLNSPGLICLFRSERSQFRWNLGRVFQSKGQPGSFSHVTHSVNYNWWGICYFLGHFLLSSSFLKNFTISPTILIQVIGSITKERKAPNPRKSSRW